MGWGVPQAGGVGRGAGRGAGTTGTSQGALRKLREDIFGWQEGHVEGCLLISVLDGDAFVRKRSEKVTLCSTPSGRMQPLAFFFLFYNFIYNRTSHYRRLQQTMDVSRSLPNMGVP